MTILIVDDDKEDGEIFREAVKAVHSESTCVVYQNGFDALTYLRSGDCKPDYIFLDVRMNVLDGKECLLKIKSIREVFRTPVFMYSTMEFTAHDQAIYKKLGARDCLAKPVTPDQLESQLRSILVR